MQYDMVNPEESSATSGLRAWNRHPLVDKKWSSLMTSTCCTDRSPLTSHGWSNVSSNHMSAPANGPPTPTAACFYLANSIIAPATLIEMANNLQQRELYLQSHEAQMIAQFQT